jgi:acyl-coenzyme A synthetase/AMP-(fatty) acid ligase
MSAFMERFLRTEDQTKTRLTTFTGNYNIADLKRQTTVFIDLLRPHNVKGKRVAVLVPQVFSYLTLVMAINELGGVVSPISPQYRSDDLKELLNFLDPHIVFTIKEHGGFPFAQAVGEWANTAANKTIVYESDSEFQWVKKTFGHTNREKQIEEDEIDFICFTSGSTGVPKGIMVKMESMEALARCFRETPDMGPGDRLGLTAPASSLFGLAVISAGLQSGLHIVLPDSFDLPLMVKLLKDTGINKILTTPSIFKAIYPFAQQMAPAILDDLEFCGLCGEVVTPEIAKQFPLSDQCRYFGMYGCSELGGLLDCDLRKEMEWSLYSGMYHKIEPDGELLVRTPGGFTGYYKRPDLTSQVWTSDQWFKTGDLVRINGNNKFDIVGRKKDLIKKGGQQVTPGEVEEILLQHANVKQAVVLGAPHPVYGEQVLAFVVLRDESLVHELYPFCAGRIAGYKVPDAIETVLEIPMVQGKTDKITLRKMFLSKEGAHE